jgi:periplasmic divalent cation tolerance protein
LAFADALLGTRLAACAQVEGPLLSCYPWQGQRQHEEEWRVTLKFPIENAAAVEAWLLANHPYETPQWLAVDAAQIAPAYLVWLRTETTTPPQLAPATGTAPVPALPRKFFQKPA